MDEHACNGYHSESAEKRDENRERKLLEEAKTIAKEYDFIVYHQGDPRGWPLDLIPIGTLIDKGVYMLDKDRELAPQTREYIASNYPTIGISVPPF
jgi:hypothetical protein